VRAGAWLVVGFDLAGHLIWVRLPAASDEEINIYPANYKPDILAAVHAYLNDPTAPIDSI